MISYTQSHWFLFWFLIVVFCVWLLIAHYHWSQYSLQDEAALENNFSHFLNQISNKYIQAFKGDFLLSFPLSSVCITITTGMTSLSFFFFSFLTCDMHKRRKDWEVAHQILLFIRKNMHWRNRSHWHTLIIMHYFVLSTWYKAHTTT